MAKFRAGQRVRIKHSVLDADGVYKYNFLVLPKGARGTVLEDNVRAYVQWDETHRGTYTGRDDSLIIAGKSNIHSVPENALKALTK